MLRRSLTAADLKEYLNADGMPSLASSLRDTVDGDKLASAFGFGRGRRCAVLGAPGTNCIPPLLSGVTV